MKVQDVMTSNVLTCRPGDSLNVGSAAAIAFYAATITKTSKTSLAT